MQCVQYMFMHYNIIVAIGVFCVVIGFALIGFWGYHMWLVWGNTTTNEGFKWSDLRESLKRQKREAEGLPPKAKVKVEMPRNIYHRGFLQPGRGAVAARPKARRLRRGAGRRRRGARLPAAARGGHRRGRRVGRRGGAGRRTPSAGAAAAAEAHGMWSDESSDRCDNGERSAGTV